MKLVCFRDIASDSSFGRTCAAAPKGALGKNVDGRNDIRRGSLTVSKMIFKRRNFRDGAGGGRTTMTITTLPVEGSKTLPSNIKH